MISFFVWLFLVCTITGCSQHTGNETSGRIAAVVNGVEITQREVDVLCQRRFGLVADSATTLNQRRSVLAGLVRTELIAQQAKKMKLDQSPEFIIALHDAQRTILAKFGEEKIAETAQPVSAATVQQAVSDNPNFFTDRKLLVYEEIIVSGANAAFIQSLNAAAHKGASLAELLDSLKAKALTFRHTTQTLTTDQVDPALLKVLGTIKHNVPVVVQVENKYSMIIMLYTEVPLPLKGPAAEQAATNLLNTRQRAIVFSHKMSEALDASTITYFGEFKPVTSGTKAIKPVVPLPVPDSLRARNNQKRQVILTASLALSWTAAMLLFFAARSILAGEPWRPRLWPAPAPGQLDGNPAPYHYDEYDDVYDVSPSVKMVLMFVRLSSVAVPGYNLFMVWNTIPLWAMGLSLTGGCLTGIFLTCLFTLPVLKNWTDTIPWFHLIEVAVFTVLLLTSVFFSFYFVNI